MAEFTKASEVLNGAFDVIYLAYRVVDSYIQFSTVFDDEMKRLEAALARLEDGRLPGSGSNG